MGFMYGNVTQHIPRTNFKFHARYPSRRAAQEDQRRYEEYQKNIDKNPTKTYVHTVNTNEYILIDYTIAPLFKEGDISSAEFFNINKNDDLNYIEGDAFAPADYHYTVWQKQKMVDEYNQEKFVYIAIARLHSILPTFETWGTYHMDVLEPLSSNPDAFGAGKIWYYPLEPIQLFTNDDLPLAESRDYLLTYLKQLSQKQAISLLNEDNEELYDSKDKQLQYEL